MEHSVLVVDNSYHPVRIENWDDALCDVISNRFTVLQYSDKFVYSAHDKWFLPEIIVDSTALRIRKHVKFKYTRVNARDNYTCTYCGNTFHPEKCSVDHIIPKDPKYGGQNTWKNCITACRKCNNKKANRTPEEAGMKLKFQPIEPANSLEYSLYGLNLKEEWMPYMSKMVVNTLTMLKQRTKV